MSDEIQITDNKLNVAFATSVQSNDIKSTSTPKAFVLGGQPGAGKSTLISEIVEELNNNVVIINGDEYRKLHPHYKELQKEYGKDAPQHTAKFAGMMTEAVLNKAIENKYNIVIEGTFRTAETPIKTLELFKNNNYETNVGILICDQSQSWISCIHRYNKMLAENPSEARYTDKKHHDLVVKNLPDNVEKVFNSGLVDRMKISNREKLLFDSKIDKEFKKEVIKNVLFPQLDKDQSKSKSLER